ncbi:MAG TPA: 1-deoxy-D-xylulose-5-phosphate reductoisomerase [Nitrospiria bacterium]|nr:1-deoxy-D-xylulose-5-phosphate reductoisomerase [Nitrospiria bacterium]
MKKIILLGSTGSIGENTLDIISRFPGKFRVVALSAWKNIDLLEKQICQFLPQIVSVADPASAAVLRDRCRNLPVEIVHGEEGAVRVASCPDGDLVVSAIVGAAGLLPTFAAIRHGKPVALANKETMVMAGELIRGEARERGVEIFPIDSEHSAIYQALAGNRREDVRKIVLTASGGPFLAYDREKKSKATPEEALRHPNWNMGKKISIDSATLMNKGLEVIEARWLFDFPVEQIEVLIHPQSIVHSMVEYQDGSVIAQMGIPDMRGPISYALNYPERLPLELPPLDLVKSGGLTFFTPDRDAFPLLGLGFEALKMGGTAPAVLNAANEEAVSAFLDRQIGFLGIEDLVRETLNSVPSGTVHDVSDVLSADSAARKVARSLIKKNL